MHSLQLLALIISLVFTVQAWPDPPCRKPPLAPNYSVDQVRSFAVSQRSPFDSLSFSMQAVGSKLVKFKLRVVLISNEVVNALILM